MTYLFLMLGYPGSGKSYVAQWLAPKFQAVHLRSDDLRLRMFGKDRLELHRERRYLLPVIRAMDYMAAQTLAAGHSVVDDANFNRRATRTALARLAHAQAAQTITVWVKTPLGVAKERVAVRSAEGVQQVFGEYDLVEHMAQALEPPTDREQVVVLDGTAPAASQVASFDAQLAVLAAHQFKTP